MTKSAQPAQTHAVPGDVGEWDGRTLLELAGKLFPTMTWWTIDFAARRVQWTGSLGIHHRLPPEGECDSPKCLLKRIHPDDVGTVRATLDRARDAGSYDIECRLTDENGGACWIREVGAFGSSEPPGTSRVAAITLEVWKPDKADEASGGAGKENSLRAPIHDLRNSLGVISNVAYLIRRPDAANMSDVSNMIEEEITRCASILSRMLAQHG